MRKMTGQDQKGNQQSTHTHTNNRKRVSSVLLEKKKGASNFQTKLSDQARDEWYGMIEGCTGVGENA